MKLLINLIRNLLGGIIAAIDFITRGTKLKRTSQAQQQVETELEKISLYQFFCMPILHQNTQSYVQTQSAYRQT